MRVERPLTSALNFPMAFVQQTGYIWWQEELQGIDVCFKLSTCFSALLTRAFYGSLTPAGLSQIIYHMAYGTPTFITSLYEYGLSVVFKSCSVWISKYLPKVVSTPLINSRWGISMSPMQNSLFLSFFSFLGNILPDICRPQAANYCWR